VEIPGEDWSNKVAITGDTKAKSMREQPKSFFLLLLLLLLLLFVMKDTTRAQPLSLRMDLSAQ
jgi:uncharacterized integral membrane protein